MSFDLRPQITPLSSSNLSEMFQRNYLLLNVVKFQYMYGEFIVVMFYSRFVISLPLLDNTTTPWQRFVICYIIVYENIVNYMSLDCFGKMSSCSTSRPL